MTVVLMLVAACLPGAKLSQGPGILGTYVVNGVDPLGTEYTGRVSITRGPNSGEVEVEWVITGAILHGEGRLQGDRLTLDWETVTSPRGSSTGNAEYEVRDDGALVGTRTVDGTDGVGAETILPEP